MRILESAVQERELRNVVPCIDGTQEVTLECGHSFILIAAGAAQPQICTECLHEALKQQRSRFDSLYPDA